MKEKTKKVLIAHQSTIPHYRVALYQKMEELRLDDWEFSVVFDEDKSVHDKFFKESVNSENFKFKVEKTNTYNINIFNRSITFQSFILRASKYDLLIVGNTINNLSYLLGFLYAIAGKPIAGWWHRHNFAKGSLKGKRNFREKILLWAAKRLKGVFAYTTGVKEYLHEQGLKEEKLFVLNNTIDINEKRDAFNKLRSSREELRDAFNLTDKKSLLFVGRLTGLKRLKFLAKTFAHLKKKDSAYHLSIIGGGEASVIGELIDKFGSDSVTHYGVVTETEQLARHYIASDLFVYPGDVGLAPLQSLCFDLPVLAIDSDNHGPEFEYLNEQNSIIMAKGTTEEEFADKIEFILQNDIKLNELRSGTWSSIEHLTIDNMARNFIQGINSILAPDFENRIRKENKSMKLEIGGEMVESNLGDNWTVMDIIPGKNVDIVHDISVLPLPIESNSCSIIYMSHVLEHILWTKTADLLKDLYRITEPDGCLEIWVPDLEKLAKAYLDNTLIAKDGWYKFNPDKDPTRWFNGRLFTYGPGEENIHKAAFDFRYLSKCLTEAGFSHTERMEKPRGYDHGWINLGVKAIK